MSDFKLEENAAEGRMMLSAEQQALEEDAADPLLKQKREHTGTIQVDLENARGLLSDAVISNSTSSEDPLKMNPKTRADFEAMSTALSELIISQHGSKPLYPLSVYRHFQPSSGNIRPVRLIELAPFLFVGLYLWHAKLFRFVEHLLRLLSGPLSDVQARKAASVLTTISNEKQRALEDANQRKKSKRKPDLVSGVGTSGSKGGVRGCNADLEVCDQAVDHELDGSPRFNQQKDLARDDYLRYGRQMIVRQVGLPGQLKLHRASVLVIGAGGLGCPALLYLARAGVGNISIVDHDSVELSNLHRQVLHTESTVGMNKAESARMNLLLGNTSVNIDAYPIPFTLEAIISSNKQGGAGGRIPSVEDFSVVLDCTDNPPSRYLISDVCAAYGIPLVSGAAIRAEGQLSVWNLPPPSPLTSEPGPCYRCIFPESQDIQGERCADQGVLGPIVGSVGVLMAWEAIRLLIGSHDLNPKLLLIPSFRTVKLRKRRKDCLGCSPNERQNLLQRIRNSPRSPISRRDEPSSTHQKPCLNNKTSPSGPTCWFNSQQIDPSPSTANRITPDDLLQERYRLDDFHILDVRPQVQFEICSIPNSINVPINEVLEDPGSTIERLQQIEASSHGKMRERAEGSEDTKGPHRWLVVCRRGHDSFLAANALNKSSSSLDPHRRLPDHPPHLGFVDLVGGLETYSLQINHQFPLY